MEKSQLEDLIEIYNILYENFSDDEVFNDVKKDYDAAIRYHFGLCKNRDEMVENLQKSEVLNAVFYQIMKYLLN